MSLMKIGVCSIGIALLVSCASSVPREMRKVPAQAGDPWAGRSDLIEPPKPAAPAAVKLPPVERFGLPNGLRVRLVSDHAWPLVNMHLVVVPAASDQEPFETRGLSDFAAEMLNKGTKTKSAEQIAEKIDFVGGSISVWADRDGTHLVCQTLTKDFDTCLELVAEIALRPTFPETEMGTIRDRLVASVRQVRDSDSALTSEHFNNLLWGDDNIRGRPRTIKSIKAIKRADLVAWHKQRFGPKVSFLAVAGDLESGDMRKRIEQRFGAWEKIAAPKTASYPEPSLKGIKIRLVDKPDQTQTQIRIGHLGIAHADKAFFPLLLANYTLGGGAFSSRLMKVVRSKGGKTYGARSGFERQRQRGDWTASTFTRNAETIATLKLVLSEIGKMHASGPTAAELADAKSNLAGSYPMRFVTAADVANMVLMSELHGLDAGFVSDYPLRLSAVTLAQARQAAAEHLHPDDLAIVLVGKAADVEPQLKAAGFTYQKVGYLEPTMTCERRAQLEQSQAKIDSKRTAAGLKLIGQALEAKGGVKRLSGIRDIQIKGKGWMKMQGKKIDIELQGYFVVPDRRRVEIKTPMGTIITVITPESVWGGMGAFTREAPAARAKTARESVWRNKDLILLRPSQDKKTIVQARDPQEEGGKRYQVVELRRPDGSLPTIAWLDEKTHLMARLVFERDGEQVIESYDDYRPVDHVLMPFRQIQKGGGIDLDLTLSEVKLNAGVPKVKFERPKTPPGK
ncbi:MAG TPA: pitrilysin family protein [Myxococcota bacterium]|nr:pitrilysin family protein [Myxococcota bacterium]